MLAHCQVLLAHLNRTEPSLLLLVTLAFPTMTSRNVKKGAVIMGGQTVCLLVNDVGYDQACAGQNLQGCSLSASLSLCSLGLKIMRKA